MKPLLSSVIFQFMMIGMICVGSAYAADIKIGVIDTQRILRESKAAEKARAVFLKDVQNKRNVLNAKQEEVRKLEEEIRVGGKDMTPRVRKERSDDLATEIKELRRLRSDLEEELKKKDMEWRRKILLDVREIVEEYQKKEKYTIILEKNSVVASDEAIDITEKIIRLYDIVK